MASLLPACELDVAFLSFLLSLMVPGKDRPFRKLHTSCQLYSWCAREMCTTVAVCRLLCVLAHSASKVAGEEDLFTAWMHEAAALETTFKRLQVLCGIQHCYTHLLTFSPHLAPPLSLCSRFIRSSESNRRPRSETGDQTGSLPAASPSACSALPR